MLWYVREISTKFQEGSGDTRSHSGPSTVLSGFRSAKRRIGVPPRPRSDTSKQERPHTQPGGGTYARFLQGSPSGPPEARWPWSSPLPAKWSS